MNAARGISLTELLISMSLALLLMNSLIQQYHLAKKYHLRFEQGQREAMDVQLASTLLRDSIRRAGFTPCAGIDHLITLDRRNPRNTLTAIQIQAQALSLSRMEEQFHTVKKQLGPKQLLVAGEPTIQVKQAVLVADCFHAEVHRVARCQKMANDWLVTLETPIHFDYLLPFYLGLWLEEHFSIKLNKQQNPALFYGIEQVEELTPAITGLSVQPPKKPLIRLSVTLQTQQGKHLVLETRVRNA